MSSQGNSDHEKVSSAMMATLAISEDFAVPEAAQTKSYTVQARSWPVRFASQSLRLSMQIAVFLWQFACLVVILSIAASLPIIQLASLGYLLEAAGRWARGERLGRCLPGLVVAGYIGTAAFWIALTSIPVFVVRDLSASAHFFAPGSSQDIGWRIGSAIIGAIWCVYVWWALLRGGRVYHFIWPAPLRFVREFFRPATWTSAADSLSKAVESIRLFYLLRIGFFGALGTLLYLIIPGLLMIGGLKAQSDGARGLLTLAGIITMMIVLQYLPFLQMRYAQTLKFSSFIRLSDVRQGFRRAPWLHAVSMVLLVLFSLPLYLLRIETPPSQLIWLLCIFFVLFNLPAKFLVGWAIRYADRRPVQRAWYNRWPAWLLMVASFPIYMLFLYLAPLSSWDGSAVMIVQHAFLLPVPFLP